MTMLEALTLARDQGVRVRPVCWRTPNARCWVEHRCGHFFEYGTWQEIPHALRLSRAEEFLGEWEVVAE